MCRQLPGRRCCFRCSRICHPANLTKRRLGKRFRRFHPASRLRRTERRQERRARRLPERRLQFARWALRKRRSKSPKFPYSTGKSSCRRFRRQHLPIGPGPQGSRCCTMLQMKFDRCRRRSTNTRSYRWNPTEPRGYNQSHWNDWPCCQSSTCCMHPPAKQCPCHLRR